jgi:hypothetical protein
MKKGIVIAAAALMVLAGALLVGSPALAHCGKCAHEAKTTATAQKPCAKAAADAQKPCCPQAAAGTDKPCAHAAGQKPCAHCAGAEKPCAHCAAAKKPCAHCAAAKKPCAHCAAKKPCAHATAAGAPKSCACKAHGAHLAGLEGASRKAYSFSSGAIVVYTAARPQDVHTVRTMASHNKESWKGACKHGEGEAEHACPYRKPEETGPCEMCKTRMEAFRRARMEIIQTDQGAIVVITNKSDRGLDALRKWAEMMNVRTTQVAQANVIK